LRKERHAKDEGEKESSGLQMQHNAIAISVTGNEALA
jgi:hypothetical protein